MKIAKFDICKLPLLMCSTDGCGWSDDSFDIPFSLFLSVIGVQSPNTNHDNKYGLSDGNKNRGLMKLSGALRKQLQQTTLIITTVLVRRLNKRLHFYSFRQSLLNEYKWHIGVKNFRTFLDFIFRALRTQWNVWIKMLIQMMMILHQYMVARRYLTNLSCYCLVNNDCMFVKRAQLL